MPKVLCYGCKYAKFSDYDNEDGEPIMYCSLRTNENGLPFTSSSWVECEQYQTSELYD